MRFKARTDLERIVDIVNKSNFGNGNKKIVANQLKGLDLFKAKAANSEDEEGVTKESREEKNVKVNNDINKLKSINNSDTNNEKSMNTSYYKQKRKKIDNSGAKRILQELYYKTHFKAASVYTVLHNNSRYKLGNNDTATRKNSLLSLDNTNNEEKKNDALSPREENSNKIEKLKKKKFKSLFFK